MTKPTRYCTLEYMDGHKIEFIFESLRDEEDPSRSFVLENLPSANNLLVELDDQLLIIPMANVRSVSISPSPAKLPGDIVRGRRISKN